MVYKVQLNERVTVNKVVLLHPKMAHIYWVCPKLKVGLY